MSRIARKNLESSFFHIMVQGINKECIFNKEIYMKIIENGGAIVSEYPIGTEPDSEKFKQRNRIVSGLSLGVLVVEAEFRSGTSITARHAIEQGKELFYFLTAEKIAMKVLVISS